MSTSSFPSFHKLPVQEVVRTVHWGRLSSEGCKEVVNSQLRIPANVGTDFGGGGVDRSLVAPLIAT